MRKPGATRRRPISRRAFLTATSAGLITSGLDATIARRTEAAAADLGRWLARPNILIILTDGQRQFRHWPSGWTALNLPSFGRLARHGLTFENAFNNAAMCSPSRATLWTSLYPAHTGVLSTNQSLSPALLNMAKVLQAAGYQVGYRGKWHLGPTPTYVDFGVWDPPDAGTVLDVGPTLGAGMFNNDARYLGTVTGNEDNPDGSGASLLNFIASYDRRSPFFLVASFVNPHDVFVAPFDFEEAGYDPSQWARLPIRVPGTWNEDLSSKPSIQSWFQACETRFNVPSWTRDERRSYAQFYAYLQTLVDRDIMTLLDALDAASLTRNTLIFRIADHGEMGLSHGLVQKTFNAYEETIHIPMIVSKPRLFPRPVRTRELVGLLDVLPTVASLAGVLHPYRGQLQGVDFSSLFTARDRPVHDFIHFTFDDTAACPPPPDIPGHIRALRTRDRLYAAYFTPTGSVFDYELYDLRNDPNQTRNLASPRHVTAGMRKEVAKLNRTLINAMAAFGTAPSGFTWPEPPNLEATCAAWSGAIRGRVGGPVLIGRGY